MLKKSALFSDIHFGRKSNSDIHNQDCCDFIDWFCDSVRSDPCIDNILFLGDWNENKSALNISTLNYSYLAAKKLNLLGLPVYFVIGNHDLYHKHTRDIHSIIPFNEFSNFTLIETPTVIPEIGNNGILLCPYLFHDEYPSLVKYNKIPFWAGHFEFKGFEITGHNMKMPTGPEHTSFKKQRYIVSGHFHKRQVTDNVVYIGNVFPMDYGDAGNNERGFATYDHEKDHMLFFNWLDCPKYIKTDLSKLINQPSILEEKARVRCLVDMDITYEESQHIKTKFIEQYNLRELILEESTDLNTTLAETESGIDLEQTKLACVDELVQTMLTNIKSEHINNDKLIKIYNTL